MPTVATVAGVKIVFYANEHPPPHFHAKIAEHQAVIDIETLEVLEGHLPAAKRRAVVAWAPKSPGDLALNLPQGCSERASGADRMKTKPLPRIKSAEVVIHGVLKIVFLDGYEGVVDLRPLIAKGRIFTWLEAEKNFAAVRVDEHGHSISWVDRSGYEIDLSADGLRRDCERQAEIHKLMAV